MKLADTAAIVTGGASGLGEATARYFAEQGAQVTILDRDAERGAQVAEEIGGHFAQTDVTSEDSVSAAIAHAVEKMGKITACVNCAAGASSFFVIGSSPFTVFRSSLSTAARESAPIATTEASTGRQLVARC